MSKATQLHLKEIYTSMGIFDFGVICVIGKQSNAAKFVDWKFEHKNGFDDATFDMGYEARGRCYFRTGYVPVIWIPHKPRTPREIATLAHECLHAVFHLTEWVAMPISRDTEEVVCHAQAHLVTNILQHI